MLFRILFLNQIPNHKTNGLYINKLNIHKLYKFILYRFKLNFIRTTPSWFECPTLVNIIQLMLQRLHNMQTLKAECFCIIQNFQGQHVAIVMFKI